MTKREYKYRQRRKAHNGGIQPISLTLSEQALWYDNLLKEFHREMIRALWIRGDNEMKEIIKSK